MNVNRWGVQGHRCALAVTGRTGGTWVGGGLPCCPPTVHPPQAHGACGAHQSCPTGDGKGANLGLRQTHLHMGMGLEPHLLTMPMGQWAPHMCVGWGSRLAMGTVTPPTMVGGVAGELGIIHGCPPHIQAGTPLWGVCAVWGRW